MALTLHPSNASRWVLCPGSVPMEAQIPQEEKSQDALEGDAAHWAAATMLRAAMAGTLANLPAGTIAPNGVVIDAEMLEAVELYVDDVIEKTGDGALDTLHIEETVTAANTVHPSNSGKPDAWTAALGPTGGYLHIPDFKFGHRFVDAFENWQLIDYAAGILERSEFVFIPRDRLQIVFTVVQPRNYHPLGPIRRWTITAAELQPYFAKLYAAAQWALAPNPETIVNPHCGDCRARHVCPALQNAADSAMDTAGSTVAIELPPDALGIELRMLQRAAEIIKARVTGLEGQALALIRSGKNVPFFQVMQGNGREIWAKPISEVIELGNLYGINLAKEPAAITPNQARKAGLDKNTVAAYSQRPPGAMSLQPVDTHATKRIFSQ